MELEEDSDFVANPLRALGIPLFDSRIATLEYRNLWLSVQWYIFDFHRISQVRIAAKVALI